MLKEHCIHLCVCTHVQAGHAARLVQHVHVHLHVCAHMCRLVTLTAQSYESKYAALAPTFAKVLQSYKTTLK